MSTALILPVCRRIHSSAELINFPSLWGGTEGTAPSPTEGPLQHPGLPVPSTISIYSSSRTPERPVSYHSSSMFLRVIGTTCVATQHYESGVQFSKEHLSTRNPQFRSSIQHIFRGRRKTFFVSAKGHRVHSTLAHRGLPRSNPNTEH